MKYKLKIQEGNGKYKKIILPQNIKLVEYVFDDMESFGEPIFKYTIEKVIDKTSSYEEICGNMCGLQISQNITVISCDFVGDDMESECKIETSELFELINIWIELNKQNF